jgi:DNA-binding transcriptional MerR regulator
LTPGLLPAPQRSPAGYRLYDDADRERLGFVGKAKATGLTLAERRMSVRHQHYSALDPDGPLACDVFLSADSAQDERMAQLRAHRSAAPVAIKDGAGVELRFRGVSWETAEAFVEHERRCCAFFTFELEEQENELVLRVWGRHSARDWLRGDLAQP